MGGYTLRQRAADSLSLLNLNITETLITQGHKSQYKQVAQRATMLTWEQAFLNSSQVSKIIFFQLVKGS